MMHTTAQVLFLHHGFLFASKIKEDCGFVEVDSHPKFSQCIQDLAFHAFEAETEVTTICIERAGGVHPSSGGELGYLVEDQCHK